MNKRRVEQEQRVLPQNKGEKRKKRGGRGDGGEMRGKKKSTQENSSKQPAWCLCKLIKQHQGPGKIVHATKSRRKMSAIFSYLRPQRMKHPLPPKHSGYHYFEWPGVDRAFSHVPFFFVPDWQNLPPPPPPTPQFGTFHNRTKTITILRDGQWLRAAK